MIPEGSDAISPAPHHDIYSIEDLRQLVYSLKEATEYQKPVIVKVAAVHNIAAIASGIARSGADIIAIDGFRGGTGAAPTRIRDHVGIPIELALAAVDQRLRDEGIRNNVSLVAGGSIRSAADVVKAVAAAKNTLASVPANYLTVKLQRYVDDAEKAETAKELQNALFGIQEIESRLAAMTNAVKGIFADDTKAQQQAKGVYTLQGVKLGDSTDNLKTGLYIVNGKKVISVK